MRYLIPLLLFAFPASAWEFTASPICTVSHVTPEAVITVTYDPREAEPYALSVTQIVPWPDLPIFGMQFEGPRPLTITTDRHMIDGPTLTVRDRGFGNVLNGLEFNQTAVALLGDLALPFPLDDAAPAISAFRTCEAAPIA